MILVPESLNLVNDLPLDVEGIEIDDRAAGLENCVVRNDVKGACWVGTAPP